MKNHIIERLNKLRNAMKSNGIDAYYIPSDDFHGSEFVSEYFKNREYFSGFTGSAGTLIVLQDEAVLYTDGRYFLQAEEELNGTGIELYKMGEQGVPSIKEYLAIKLSDKSVIGFDGRCVNTSFVLELKKYFDKKGIDVLINGNYDLANEIRGNDISLPNTEAYVLEEKYTGISSLVKMDKVREEMIKKKCNVFVLTSLDDICWLLNIRGNDIEYSPLVLSYMIITDNEAYFYCGSGNKDDEKLKNIYDYLESENIIIKPYDIFYEYIDVILGKMDNVRVIADTDKINYKVYEKISKYEIVNIINPTTNLKAIKNDIEITNEKNAHIKDGVAFAKFLYWFDGQKKIGFDKANLSEIDIAKRLYEERAKMEGFVEESFEPIVAYGKNGAIVHYSADELSNAVLENKSFVLIDTGGHYFEGSTDITRTISCGELTDEEKRCYTLVLKGHLALSKAVFLEGTTGANLDILARKPLWDEGLNYNHGTGHGVGYLMNVHEGPNNIRYRLGSGKNISKEIVPGMITSNEPGIYLEGKFGIRLENLIICKDKCNNSFGNFYEFENLTLVPFDLEAIDMNLLDEKEREILNDYHREVYEKISGYLEEEEREFLKEITKEI